MSGDSIDLISTIKELEEMQPELRKLGEFRKANMLDFAIGYLNKYKRLLQERDNTNEDCDKEPVKEVKMTDKNQNKCQFVKDVLDNLGLLYTELPNGQFKVDTVNIWATSEKWFDTKTNAKGQGINGFLRYLKDKGVMEG